MRRLDRAFDRLASRGRRSDPEVVIDRLERRLGSEPAVVRIPEGPGMEKYRTNVTRRRGLVIAGAAVAAALLVATPLWFLWRGGDSPVVSETTTTEGATSTTTVTTTTAGFGEWSPDPLSAFQAGEVPPAAVCPAGSTPDTPGDGAAPRPPAVDAAAFDRESGLLVASVGGATWTFDPCRNRWTEMGGGGPNLGDGEGRFSMGYDADSDLIVAFDDTGVYAYDVDEDTWTLKGYLGAAGQPVYHDPSGLLLLDGRWAYDVATHAFEYLGEPDAGVPAYDPRDDRFYLFGDDGVQRYEPGAGWTQLGIATDSPFPGSFTSGVLAFDEAAGRFVAFSGGVVAAFDPAVPGWEVLHDGSGQAGPLKRNGHRVAYDPANGRLLVVGGEYLTADGAWVPATDVWAFDTRTRGWTEVLPAIPRAIEATAASADDLAGSSLVAVSAREMWAWGGSLIGHLKDGAWAFYRRPVEDILQMALAPDGTVWATTGAGVFSFDGVEWIRRFDGAASILAVAPDGAVYIGGPADSGLLRWDGASWASSNLPIRAVGRCWENSGTMTISPDGRIWIASGGGWCGGELERCAGGACEVVHFGDYPEGFQVQVNAIAAAPNGDELWALGLGWFQDDEGNISGLTDVIARFDGEGWTTYDSPSVDLWGVGGLAVGPDGMVWFAAPEEGLVSFDETDWTYHLQGQTVMSYDVAPDGTVWYSDEAGFHVLGSD